MQVKADTKLGDLVAKDVRLASVLSAYGLDFCCHGGRTLADACLAEGIDFIEVQEKLLKTHAAEPTGEDSFVNRFETWSLSLMVDYLCENHHAFVKERSPILSTGLEKIAKVHGERHPELPEIFSLFCEMAQDLHQHMWKEENVLFPYIKFLDNQQPLPWPNAPFKNVQTPINAMKTEHEREGDRLFRLRALTGNYTIPSDACNTYTATYSQLKEFDQDLIQHIHIENNILFPKAIAMDTR